MGKHDNVLSPSERDEIVGRATKLAADFAAAGAAADSNNRFPLELVPLYKASGLPKIAVPKQYGGDGADIWTTALVSRELAKGDPAIALSFNMHQTMIGIFRGLLDEDSRKRVFGRIVEENLLVSGPFSEDRAGLSGLADTIAVPDGSGGWRVSGKKSWATLIEAADLVAFNATITDESGHLPDSFVEHASREAVFVIPANSPGLSVVRTWDTLGMRATGTQTLVFDEVSVPAEAYGGNFREGLFGEFEWASMSFASVYQGLAEKAYEAAKAILRKKTLGATQEGQDVALKNVGFVQYNLGKLKTDVEASARVLEATAQILVDGRDGQWNPASRVAFLDVGKVTATETAIRVADGALRLVGGQAFRRGHVLERLYRDARGGPFHPLTTDAAYDLIGRSELGLFDPPAEPASVAEEPAEAVAVS
ncbi:acyl-CoA dehydrogenase family protein [Arthrobacter ramosus]|uniref:Acyl-CoA dehydrogenase family protein n=1 Tax=Arthrobacter ramosus TaxID=1672 RepID=A0ABV5Y4J2_ARTRM|nr:acyl-CoA dehydrogenase family protein [Arthrobacter ramosus]